MRILVACEFSQIVCKAFRDKGHEAYSCDILPTEGNPKWHIQDDVLKHLGDGWDLMIAHPPCTYLAVSGARWFKYRKHEQELALHFIIQFIYCNIDKWAIENPIGVISTRIMKPTQIIQPWMFGHGETKATCLWLKNLPLLNPTNVVNGRIGRVHHEPPSLDRWKNRSRTYTGIAKAMAEQWG
jgi:hypothetical protein